MVISTVPPSSVSDSLTPRHWNSSVLSPGSIQTLQSAQGNCAADATIGVSSAHQKVAQSPPRPQSRCHTAKTDGSWTWQRRARRQDWTLQSEADDGIGKQTIPYPPTACASSQAVH
eukprot:554777-Rhodomonas_salina.3